MTSDPRLNRAASPLQLRTKEGKDVELLLTPLSDKDMTELDEWVRAKYIANARASIPPEATQEERRETLSIAMDKAFGLSFISGLGAQMMGTVEGVARLIWQSVKTAQPDLSYEFVRGLMFNTENIRTSNDKWKALNLGPSKNENAPGPDQSNRGPKNRKKTRRKGRKSTAN